MNMVKTFGIGTLLAVSGLASIGHAQDVDLQDEDVRIAYSIGVNIGQSLVQQGLLDGLDFES